MIEGALTIEKNYFNIADYITEQTRRYYVVGKRGAGKSYSIKKHLLTDYKTRKAKFIVVVRTTPDITVSKMNTVFKDVEHDADLHFDELGYGEFHSYHIMFKSGNFWLVGETEEGDLEWLTDIGIATALSMGNRFKGGVYNDYKNIFYDEFISEAYATFNEVEMFNKILLTVARAGVNDGVRCFFAGNPDSGIERSAFLYPLKLDYAHLSNNSPYYFDTTINGKTHANNILFIKIAGATDDYIDTATIDVSNREVDMSLSGEVKTNIYCNLTLQQLRQMDPNFEMIVETPILTPNEYHKKVYAYITELYDQPALIISTHRLRCTCNRIYCRYEAYDIRKRECYQTYRINLPSAYHAYKAVLSDCITTRMIFTNDNSMATLFFDILENG